MLRPIKNFLTYLQKNASSGTIFGTSSSMNDEPNTSVDVDMESGAAVTEINASAEEKTSTLSHDQNENDVLDSSIPEEILSFDEPGKDLETSFDEGEFTVTELVVVENPDLNSSINSDPSQDPLAIDEFPDDLGGSSNALDEHRTQTPADIDADGNILYIINVNKIKEQAIARADPTATALDEEQEIRSDGSDSGLGLETSTIQTTATDEPLIKPKPSRSNLKRPASDNLGKAEKKPKRSINFDGVKIYYFPRIQGFGCVPSQGGCTLGMDARHTGWKVYTLAEHAAEQRRAHKQQMQEVNPRGSSSDETDSDEELSEASGSDLDTDTNGFLQPVHAKQRRAILKAAGVRKIDPSEKDDCKLIRTSREHCGCNCRGFCDPETCACSQAGIKCQVDRASFPCGCTRDNCDNVVGRIEFNPTRVRTHFIHTIMRLELESRQQKGPDVVDTATSYNCGTSNMTATASASANTYNYNSFSSSQYSSNIHNIHSHQTEYMNGHHNGAMYVAGNGGGPTSAAQDECVYTNDTSALGVTNAGYGFLDNVMYPPYVATPHYPSPNPAFPNYQANYSNYTTPLAHETQQSGDFISLHSPVGNSSRLDAINDLLQNNRNTPPALETLPQSSTADQAPSLSLSPELNYPERHSPNFLGFAVEEIDGSKILDYPTHSTAEASSSATQETSAATKNELLTPVTSAQTSFETFASTADTGTSKSVDEVTSTPTAPAPATDNDTVVKPESLESKESGSSSASNDPDELDISQAKPTVLPVPQTKTEKQSTTDEVSTHKKETEEAASNSAPQDAETGDKEPVAINIESTTCDTKIVTESSTEEDKSAASERKTADEIEATVTSQPTALNESIAVTPPSRTATESKSSADLVSETSTNSSSAEASIPQSEAVEAVEDDRHAYDKIETSAEVETVSA